MSLFKLFFYLMTLIGCHKAGEEMVVVIGYAQDAKAGAVVIAKDDRKNYYVEGLAYWDKKAIGKLVNVSGNLIIEKFELQKEEKESQQFMGIKRTIKNPKWALVK